MDLNLVFQGLQAAGQVMAAGAAIYAVLLVHSYTRRKDRVDFLRNMWHEQQLTNYHALSSEGVLRDFETIVYGKGHDVSTDTARKYFILFVNLNKMQSYWFAKENSLISEKECDDFMRKSLPLIKREEDLVKYFLKERGYYAEFATMILELLPHVPFVTPPSAGSTGG